MTAKPVVPRAKARKDAELAVDHYLNEATPDVAIDFVDALEQAYAFIATNPAAGSPPWSHELNLPGLRAIRLKGFPWRVFYLECETHVDAWRVLHAKRDLPAWMDDTDESD
ncbi:MAG: type II toxin-antitoxin system RelE/ParE family toxin [Novosphingobium sp.]